MSEKMNSRSHKRIAFVVFGTTFAALLVVFFLCEETSSPKEPKIENPAVSSDRATPARRDVSRETPKQRLERLREFGRLLSSQRGETIDSSTTAEAATPRKQPASSEPEPVRTSTEFERRATRELIVLESIFGMLKEGDTKKALIMLDQQRALFPEGNEVETAAFELILGCIQENSDRTRNAAADFLTANPDFRLNKHINRLCFR